jgi:cell division septal protein FtsQ
MWLKRKPKNRRFEREHILDVKVQSRQLRSMRLRLVGTLTARLLLAALAFFVLWRGGNWVLQECVLHNPAFAIQKIDIETDGILPQRQLRACAGVNEGENLLALDLARIQRDLEYLPWIQSAAVERVRPKTLRIRVIEREPVAQATLFSPIMDGEHPGSMQFYFDADGHVMLPLDTLRRGMGQYGFDSLPVLTGLAGVELHPSHQVESSQIQSALRLLEEFGRSSMYGLADLTNIDVAVPELLQVSTSQGALITFGVDNLRGQLQRWRLVYDYALQSGKAIASLDLSVSNNVPARWLESSAVPPPRPRPLKPSPYRKKHV